jgi:hypothetical protein
MMKGLLPPAGLCSSERQAARRQTLTAEAQRTQRKRFSWKGSTFSALSSEASAPLR